MKSVFHKIVAGLNLLVGLVWLVGYSAAYINPSHYWIGAVLAVGLPFMTLVLIPFAVFHAARRRWVLLAAHVIVIALALNRQWSVDRWRRPHVMRDDRTLMTFNTPRYPDTEEAMRRTSALVRRTRPDLIAIQESIVWATKRDPAKIRTHAKFRAVVDSMNYTAKPPYEGPEGASWVRWIQPVLSLDPIENQKQLTFERDIPGWPTFYVLRTEMEYGGRRMALYNIHLFTHGSSKPWNEDGNWFHIDRWIRYLSEVRIAFSVRAWQAERIRDLIERETLPVVVCGDFNGTADNWAYHHIGAGLQDAFRLAGTGWGATYHARFPFLRIDFVLLGPEFEAVRARVPLVRDTGSDHRPLVVRFRWRHPESTETGAQSRG